MCCSKLCIIIYIGTDFVSQNLDALSEIIQIKRAPMGILPYHHEKKKKVRRFTHASISSLEDQIKRTLSFTLPFRQPQLKVSFLCSLSIIASSHLPSLAPPPTTTHHSQPLCPI